jgi:hypothetical protein
MPESAADYYATAARQAQAFEFREVGRDVYGRRTFQKYDENDEPYGALRSLKPYAEYRAAVVAASRISSSMGVSLWCAAVVEDGQ